MRRSIAAALLCGAFGLAGACGGERVDGPLASAGPAEWATLAEARWTLASGSEPFVCALQTVQSDLYVRAFRADAPPGTHHTVVTVTEPTGPDRGFDCGPGALSDAMIFASGFGTDDLGFPEGVAIFVPAGKQILLNLHLLNATPNTLSGTSRTLVQTLSPDLVVAEAEVVFAGTVDFALPPHAEATATGSCLFEQDVTLLSV